MTDKIIYIVTRGSYSDYHILGVFDDKAKAESVAAFVNADYGRPIAEIEEWSLNAE